MTALGETLLKLRENGRKGLIVYFTAGYPNYDITAEAVVAAAEAGADIIEIGLPFSDPMADGPVIQKAATEALAQGATTAGALQMIHSIQERSAVPLAVMTYFNTVLQYGIDKFTADFAQAGVSGLIIPDLPAEECSIIVSDCRAAGLDFIQFVAPTSTEERIESICSQAGGFLYCISTTGVTGVRDIDYSTIGQVISKVRRYTAVPVAIGFGIGSGPAACAAAQHADAVIIGSAVMELLRDGGVETVRKFVREMRNALDDRRE